MSSRPESAVKSTHAAMSKAGGSDEPIDGYRRLQALLHEDSVQGALRRALDSIEGLDFDLARTAAIEPKHLKDFYWGDAELAGEEIDRLARVLHLQLLPENR